MKFFLFLVLFGTESPDMYYAVHTDMTAEDCTILLEKQQRLLEKTFDSSDFQLTCEIDEASLD